MSRKSVPVILVLPLLAVLTAACGKIGDLEPGAGQSKVPVAYGAKKSQTAEELFAPSVQARPGRSDELLKRSERRDDDPFDLPPGGKPVPLPDQVEKEKNSGLDTNTDPQQK